jgi:uncharacterized membrane protein YtjA (UPF0391 family)
MIAWAGGVGGIPIAHAGHWIASLLYVVPVLLIVGALLWQSWREKRAKGGAKRT